MLVRLYLLQAYLRTILRETKNQFHMKLLQACSLKIHALFITIFYYDI